MQPEKSRKTRVVLYVPDEIHEFVQACCERIIKVKGKEVRFTKSLSEVYIEFIKRGITSLEDKDDKDTD
jgi:hypothetical protein